MIFGLGNRQKIKEDMSLSNLGTVAFHAAKVPTNVFSSTLICLLTLDYMVPSCPRFEKNLVLIYFLKLVKISYDFE